MLDVWFFLWLTVPCRCCLCCCLSYSSFGHWELFQVGLCPREVPPSLFVSFPDFLASETTPLVSSVPALESTTSLGALVLFTGEWYLGVNFWALDLNFFLN